jgi:hypothetical protein
MSHTMGPWKKGEVSRVYGADNSPIAVVLHWPHPLQYVSNLALISSAPELLEALVCMERLIVELYPGHIEPELEHIGEYQAVWNAVQNARAAIAKALPEQFSLPQKEK